MQKFLTKLCSVAALGFLGFNSAQALTLECTNVESVPIAVSVSYLDYDNKTWQVEGWYTLEAGVKAKIELPSNNDIFYIYGEFQGGSEVQGGSGSLALPIYYSSFKYDQAKQTQMLKPDNVVYFVRGVASNGFAEIAFGPIRQ